jgi:hypothetical protein
MPLFFGLPLALPVTGSPVPADGGELGPAHVKGHAYEAGLPGEARNGVHRRRDDAQYESTHQYVEAGFHCFDLRGFDSSPIVRAKDHLCEASSLRPYDRVVCELSGCGDPEAGPAGPGQSAPLR